MGHMCAQHLSLLFSHVCAVFRDAWVTWKLQFLSQEMRETVATDLPRSQDSEAVT